jgi:hypothetical protein
MDGMHLKSTYSRIRAFIGRCISGCTGRARKLLASHWLSSFDAHSAGAQLRTGGRWLYKGRVKWLRAVGALNKVPLLQSRYASPHLIETNRHIGINGVVIVVQVLPLFCPVVALLAIDSSCALECAIGLQPVVSCRPERIFTLTTIVCLRKLKVRPSVRCKDDITLVIGTVWQASAHFVVLWRHVLIARRLHGPIVVVVKRPVRNWLRVGHVDYYIVCGVRSPERRGRGGRFRDAGIATQEKCNGCNKPTLKKRTHLESK